MAGSASLGKLEIKFDKFDDIYDEIDSCKELYQTRINHLQRVRNSLNNTSTNYFSNYIENEIENAIDDIDTQIFVYSQHVSGMDTIKETIRSLEQEAEDTEERIAKHINTELGDFCKTNDIEVDDPDEEKKWYEKVGDFFEDVGDGIKQFYEDFKYVFNFVLDIVITVVAVVALVVAIAAVTVGTAGTGFVAIASIVAAGFALYESGASTVASGIALYHHCEGNEEKAQYFTDVRNNGAGNFFIVQGVGKLTGGNETAMKIANGIYCVTSIACTAFSLYNVGAGAVKVAKATQGGKLTKVAAGIKSLFKPSPRGTNINEGEAFDEVMGIWQAVDRFDPSVETLETLYNLKGNVESITANLKIVNGIMNLNLLDGVEKGDVFDGIDILTGALNEKTNAKVTGAWGDLNSIAKNFDKILHPSFE